MLGPLQGILNVVITALTLTILAAVVISWLRAAGVRVPHYNPIVRIIEDTSEAILRPIRRAIPTSAGRWDFAPLVAIVILQILQAIIARL
jgi:uncharacterized protein YggT (Ycf19 family)